MCPIHGSHSLPTASQRWLCRCAAAGLAECKFLSQLRLDHNRLAAATLAGLFDRCLSLKELDISDNADIRSLQVSELRTSFALEWLRRGIGLLLEMGLLLGMELRIGSSPELSSFVCVSANAALTLSPPVLLPLPTLHLQGLKLRVLATLRASGNRIAEIGALHLVGVPALEELHLDRNAITSAPGLAPLSRLSVRVPGAAVAPARLRMMCCVPRLSLSRSLCCCTSLCGIVVCCISVCDVFCNARGLRWTPFACVCGAVAVLYSTCVLHPSYPLAPLFPLPSAPCRSSSWTATPWPPWPPSPSYRP